MQTNQERVDRRVDRTVTALRKALIDLILEKHYDSITVQDIIDRANIGRSTFYTHFVGKEDLQQHMSTSLGQLITSYR